MCHRTEAATVDAPARDVWYSPVTPRRVASTRTYIHDAHGTIVLYTGPRVQRGGGGDGCGAQRGGGAHPHRLVRQSRRPGGAARPAAAIASRRPASRRISLARGRACAPSIASAPPRGGPVGVRKRIPQTACPAYPASRRRTALDRALRRRSGDRALPDEPTRRVPRVVDQPTGRMPRFVDQPTSRVPRFMPTSRPRREDPPTGAPSYRRPAELAASRGQARDIPDRMRAIPRAGPPIGRPMRTGGSRRSRMPPAMRRRPDWQGRRPPLG